MVRFPAIFREKYCAKTISRSREKCACLLCPHYCYCSERVGKLTLRLKEEMKLLRTSEFQTENNNTLLNIHILEMF